MQSKFVTYLSSKKLKIFLTFIIVENRHFVFLITIIVFLFIELNLIRSQYSTTVHFGLLQLFLHLIVPIVHVVFDWPNVVAIFGHFLANFGPNAFGQFCVFALRNVPTYAAFSMDWIFDLHHLERIRNLVHQLGDNLGLFQLTAQRPVFSGHIAKFNEQNKCLVDGKTHVVQPIQQLITL